MQTPQRPSPVYNKVLLNEEQRELSVSDEMPVKNSMITWRKSDSDLDFIDFYVSNLPQTILNTI
jgi:hypothetical protein